MEVREPIPVYNKLKLTAEEYLRFEKDSLDKHEFFQGEVFAMAGASPRHNVIFSNLFGELAYRLKGNPCRPYGSDLRIHIPENTLYTYSDISIICGEIVPTESDEDTAKLPTVLIEILSNSSRDYDRGGKFRLYRDIPSLKEFIVIDSQQIGIEAYRINPMGHWELEDYRYADQTLFIHTVGISMSLTEIYQGTKL
jgi:Uma2 family endonuclease